MSPKITEFLYKHKGLFEAALLPAVVVLVGLSAFGLGRLSVTGLPTAVAAPSSAKTVSAEEGRYVASKTGTKYYLPSCAGVSNIKEENRVYFASVAQAQAAGYTAAANCPGL